MSLPSLGEQLRQIDEGTDPHSVLRSIKKPADYNYKKSENAKSRQSSYINPASLKTYYAVGGRAGLRRLVKERETSTTKLIAEKYNISISTTGLLINKTDIYMENFKRIESLLKWRTK